MAIYQISYDLRNKRDYKALYERIKSYGTWCRPLESVWIIKTDQSAAQVRDYIAAIMDADDQLLVSAMTAEWASWNIDSEVSRYMTGFIQVWPA